jgi:hypothetical protein
MSVFQIVPYVWFINDLSISYVHLYTEICSLISITIHLLLWLILTLFYQLLLFKIYMKYLESSLLFLVDRVYSLYLYVYD